MNDDQVISDTKKWITDVVIGCNFCPFAAPVVKQQKVFYQLESSLDLKTCMEKFVQEAVRLDQDPLIETSFLIFSHALSKFTDFLDFLENAERTLKHKGYTGIYQIASFHPSYLFAGSSESDAANYTNRSPYPMLQFLREESMEKALANYPSPEKIPHRNINFAREKGLVYMKMLRDSSMSGIDAND